MRHTLLFILTVFEIVNVYSQNSTWSIQKPSLDTSVLDKWPFVYNASISNDGNFAFYITYNIPPGSRTLIVQKRDNTWRQEFAGVASGVFAGSNNQLIFVKNDTLKFLTLGTDRIENIANVQSYKVPRQGNSKWLAYQLNAPVNEVVLINLDTKYEQRYSSVVEYMFNDVGNSFIIKTKVHNDSTSSIKLQWNDLEKNHSHVIWASSSQKKIDIGGWRFDSEGKQFIFMVEENKKDRVDNAIWYYKIGMNEAVLKINNQSPGIGPGFNIIKNNLLFSKNGRHIFFSVQQDEVIKPRSESVKVDIWSYRDSVLQSTQLLELQPKTYCLVINIENSSVARLEQDDERIITNLSEADDYVILLSKASIVEYWWKLSSQPTYWLLSLKNYSRKLLNANRYSKFSFSPSGNYLVYYDTDKQNYFSYHMESGKLLNISKLITVRLSDEYQLDGLLGVPKQPVGIGGWLSDESALFIYDNYDIWQVDPSNKTNPLNLTNDYGRINKIKLRLVYEDNLIIKDSNGTKLLITAYNVKNKNNGFFRCAIGIKKNPELLTMGPFRFYFAKSHVADPEGDGMIPIKANDSPTWIVKRQTATEAPNYFFTSDFKNYEALSNIQPQKRFNWLTAELINWRQLDGTMSQGILYRPENFDPNKKYPIIFNYYQTKSYLLYEFPMPGYMGGNINIPWFVSQGYLVFIPDINYKIGKTGESVFNSVFSAAQYFSKKTWVDAKKMGIQGHSFGGYETNYLVTHTSIFAAAVSAAGVINTISSYGALTGGSIYKEVSRQTGYESRQGRIGASLWQRPDLYVSNSPVFNLNKVTTPILIMHNKLDNLVPWTQAIEYFTGLRRLGKKAWMLQYDKGAHTVSGKEAIDYTIRVNQFFDHYLKDFPPACWLTNGIPAKLKGIDTGYELDLRPGIVP